MSTKLSVMRYAITKDINASPTSRTWNLNALRLPFLSKTKKVIGITFPGLNLINDGDSVQRNRATPGRSIRRVQLIINSIPSTSVKPAHKINNQLRSKLTIFRIALQLEPSKLGTFIRRAPLYERELSESGTI